MQNALRIHGIGENLMARAAAAVQREGYDFDVALVRFLYHLSFCDLEPFELVQTNEGCLPLSRVSVAGDVLVVEDVLDGESEQMHACARLEGYTLDDLVKDFVEHLASRPSEPFDFVRQPVLFEY